jgi:hypothetical protein
VIFAAENSKTVEDVNEFTLRPTAQATVVYV